MQNKDDRESGIPGMKWGDTLIPKNAFIPPNFHIPRHMKETKYIKIIHFKPPKHMRKDQD